MSLAAPTPPLLLLTKRLTSFLRANLTPQIHTALLTTLSGKLLAHASTQPVSTLRTQCTVAASLWALYAAPSTTAHLAEALPRPLQPQPQPQSQSQSQSQHPSSSSSRRPLSSSAAGVVTIQLTGAVLVIKKLKCGLLFVCMGPTVPSPEGGGGEPQQQMQGQQIRPMQASQQHLITELQQPPPAEQLPPPGSPSEVESVMSAGAATTASVATTTASVAASAVVLVRRQAEELARWLDDKMGSLGVPEEGFGLESR
ncbi:hypothetical protein F4778DRAFT_537810 [Xylariomycetidae sp. FL2044]|nr:hypothetical protein F4778DRAFT_537810 [Xylariomycetidae sp. FL2044]